MSKEKAETLACQSMGTKQCAAICLSHSSNIPLGECPSKGTVWTLDSILMEYKRRPVGPLVKLAEMLDWKEPYSEKRKVSEEFAITYDKKEKFSWDNMTITDGHALQAAWAQAASNYALAEQMRIANEKNSNKDAPVERKVIENAFSLVLMDDKDFSVRVWGDSIDDLSYIGTTACNSKLSVFKHAELVNADGSIMKTYRYGDRSWSYKPTR